MQIPLDFILSAGDKLTSAPQSIITRLLNRDLNS